MALSRSAEFAASERRALLGVARDSITCAVRSGRPSPIQPHGMPESLSRHRACFVTLYQTGLHLRGCIGSLEAARPLIEEVAETACSAALHDPRFHPVREEELHALSIEISVLSPLTAIDAHSEQRLIDNLQPGIDGLVLDFGDRRATFLPKLWEQLPEPIDFVEALKQKAGLPADFWSDDVRAYRYLTETFSEPDGIQASA
ncbi:MAG: AmmeMemoRadiSam system protein A [Gammaproteobacteria bacterium]|jgi:AmmeMemoRadiSam system protein A|nr:MAG: AmmeMemoRadiSam system protein A [Gammaproteobacteria bacterium]